jgi:hypothetical protein
MAQHIHLLSNAGPKKRRESDSNLVERRVAQAASNSSRSGLVKATVRPGFSSDYDSRLGIVTVEEPVAIDIEAFDAAPKLLIIASRTRRMHRFVPHPDATFKHLVSGRCTQTVP